MHPRNYFIGKERWRQTGTGLYTNSTRLLMSTGSRQSPNFVDEILVILDLPLHLVAVIPVVGKCGVDVGQGQLRESRDDLVRRNPFYFVPGIDVLDTDPRACDARPPAANPRRTINVSDEYAHD